MALDIEAAAAERAWRQSALACRHGARRRRRHGARRSLAPDRARRPGEFRLEGEARDHQGRRAAMTETNSPTMARRATRSSPTPMSGRQSKSRGCPTRSGSAIGKSSRRGCSRASPPRSRSPRPISPMKSRPSTRCRSSRRPGNVQRASDDQAAEANADVSMIKRSLSADDAPNFSHASLSDEDASAELSAKLRRPPPLTGR